MRSNHDPAIVTLFHSTLEHTLDHFLEFWIFEGVRHFLAIFAQPPTTLLTLHNKWKTHLNSRERCDFGPRGDHDVFRVVLLLYITVLIKYGDLHV